MGPKEVVPDAGLGTSPPGTIGPRGAGGAPPRSPPPGGEPRGGKGGFGGGTPGDDVFSSSSGGRIGGGGFPFMGVGVGVDKRLLRPQYTRNQCPNASPVCPTSKFGHDRSHHLPRLQG